MAFIFGCGGEEGLFRLETGGQQDMAGKNGSASYKATGPTALEEGSAWQQPTCEEGGEGERTGEADERARSEEDPKDHAQASQHDTTDQSAPERPPTMDSQRPTHDRKPPRGMLDRSLQAQLGRQLRSIYSDIASEPVPERFVKLLEELEAREKHR
jgi:Anti-sigma factor NepR